MENKTKRNSILTGAVLAGALAAFTISTVEARPATTRVLGNGAELRNEIINLNVVSSPANVFEMKCGAGTTEKGKEAKKKANAKNGKTIESKCGEGKCGTNKNTKAEKKTEKKADKKSKTTEGKCGQGKCGAA